MSDTLLGIPDRRARRERHAAHPGRHGTHRTRSATVAGVLAMAVVMATSWPSSLAATKKPTKSATTAAAAKGRISVGETGEAPGLDPAAVFVPITAAGVVNAIYDTLMDVPYGKAPVPQLASALVEQPDRKSWTLTIRSGVRFHDGTALTAEAVKVNLERQRRSPLNGPTMALITSIDVTGPLTLRLTLGKPFGSMPYLLGSTAGIMVSPKAIKEKAATLNRGPSDAGTGPYILKEWVSGDRTVVVRNPKYWGSPKPRLDQITFRVVPDEAARYGALRAGDLQVDATVFPNIVDQARKDGYAVVDPPIAGSAATLFNNAKAPFDDVRIRRAAALAIDRRAISTLFNDPNVDKAGNGLWPIGNPWYTAGEESTFDQAEARRLVDAYTKDTGRAVAFTYMTAALGGTVTDSARLQVKYWQDAGMDVKLQVLPDANALVINVATGQYQAAGWLVGLESDPDATAYPVLSSTSPVNFSKYKSAEMDALLEAGRAAGDVATRKPIYADVQRLFRKDVPFLVGSPGTLHFVIDPKVCGVGDTGPFTAKTVGLGNC